MHQSGTCSRTGVQVLLPVEPDARVPDWILDRTPTEVKAAYAAAVKKREQGQVCLTPDPRPCS